jgi:glycosyltransferase involved in cell wall biosynthesis
MSAIAVDGLACVVMSLRNEPGLVDAVRSIVEQSDAVETLVVNSGGGDPQAHLRSAGLDIPVINRVERLLPGGARNLGIAATRSRYVAFLAADCVAQPGWAAGRLREHRRGADVVAGVLTNAYPDNASAVAFALFLHYRRSIGAAASKRLLYGLSYDRHLFDRFGLFREDLRVGEDTEFNNRLKGRVAFAFAPGVSTAHRNPTDPIELVRDLYDRGRLRAAAERALHGRGRRAHIAVSTLLSAPWGLPEGIRSTPSGRRGTLVEASMLLVPAVAAYLAGVLRPSSSSLHLLHGPQLRGEPPPGR